MTLSPPFGRISFARQFLIACAVILVVGMATLGHWLGRQIETTAVRRTAAIAAVYVESILADRLRDWGGRDVVAPATRAVLDELFVRGPLQRKVRRFKLWGRDGRIAYSSDAQQQGLRFPIDADLAAAYAGSVQARISDLEDADNQREHLRWPQLLEVYVPLRRGDGAEVIGVAEFYHATDNLGHDIREARQQTWLLVGVSTLAIYLLLYGLVRRADRLIATQRRDLEAQLRRLQHALEEIRAMRQQLAAAGVRTTALNEQFLRRVAADLHDGPAQTIALAKMRFDELTAALAATTADGRAAGLNTVREALRIALQELRDIAGGMAIPGIGEWSLGDTTRRVVREFERAYGARVALDLAETGEAASLAVMITLYRVIQESLANCWQHARTATPQVSVHVAAGRVHAEIADDGPGFDPDAPTAGHFGLSFMRERVRLLGGDFTLATTPGRGTRIRIDLPLSTDDSL